MRYYALIPARAGSQGIKDKNISIVKSYPLIAYSIIAARMAGIEDVYISTDSEHIAEIARYYGAKVPFLRPAEISQSKSLDIEYCRHIVNWFKDNNQILPDCWILLRPTTPLREPSDIISAINIFSENYENITSLRSIHELCEPIEKMVRIDEKTRLFEYPFENKDYHITPRQNFKISYHPGGTVDILKTKQIEKGDLYGDKILGFEAKFSVDIDRKEDLKWTEFYIEKYGNKIYDYLESNYKGISILNDIDKYEARCMHNQFPIIWKKAEGSVIEDINNDSFIDFTSGIAVTNIGHSNNYVLEALKDQINSKLIYSYTFATEIKAKFLKKLSEFTGYEKAMLFSAGTEATEHAIRLMKLCRFKNSQKNDFKNIIISFGGAMHGRTLGAEALKGNTYYFNICGDDFGSFKHLRFPDNLNWNDFSKAIEELGINKDDIAGFIIESYRGWDARLCPKEYIQDLMKFAKENEILVCFDEIQAGFYRTGKKFCFEHYEIRPDLICLGKGLSGGLPISAICGNSEILDIIDPGDLSSTQSGNALCCAGALANIEELEKLDLNLIGAKGTSIMSILNLINKTFPDKIIEVNGKGMAWALITKNKETADNICERALKSGLLLTRTGRESVKILPPLNISMGELERGLNILYAIIEGLRR